MDEDPTTNTAQISDDTTAPASNSQGSDDSMVILNMEGMIKSHISALDRFQEELTKYQGLLDDIFNNDPTYKEHTEKAKEAAKIKSATKQQILKMPQAADLDNKVKNLRQEIKEHKASLSDYLREFQRLSGINEIEGEDGELREIVYTAKLIKKGSNFN